jgi:hypothetical protein
MTKKKTEHFSGTWMDGRLPEALLRPILDKHIVFEDDKRRILSVLSRQIEIWRFEFERRAKEPEPAQWASLVAAVEVPNRPDALSLMELNRALRKLPLHVQAVLAQAVFEQFECSIETLCTALHSERRLWLSGWLQQAVTELKRLRGKRGPRANVADPLRAVHAVIFEVKATRGTDRRKLAAELLKVCGIPAPTSRARLAAMLAEPRRGRGKL